MLSAHYEPIGSKGFVEALADPDEIAKAVLFLASDF